MLPWSPDEIKVKVKLNTKKTGKRQEILDWHNPEKLDKSSFDPTKPTVIITHGFRSGIEKEWLVELADVSRQSALDLSQSQKHHTVSGSSLTL